MFRRFLRDSFRILMRAHIGASFPATLSVIFSAEAFGSAFQPISLSVAFLKILALSTFPNRSFLNDETQTEIVLKAHLLGVVLLHF